MKIQKLLEPIQIGKLEVRNRVVSTGHATHLVTRDARDMVSQKLIDYHAARARGGAGIIINEATCVHPGGKLFPTQLCIYDDKYITGFNDLAEGIHKHGAKHFIQLHHGGRICNPLVCRGQPVAPSVKPESWFSLHRKPYRYRTVVPRALSVTEIHDITESFADGARRASEAEVDGVELHCGHGYLLSQFLSPVVNQRTDEYGQDHKGRARFTVEIIQRIRETYEDLVVGCRINGADYIQGGATGEDAKIYAKMFEEAGADYINVSGGFYGSYPATIAPIGDPHGLYVPQAQMVKTAVNIPVLTVGRITDPIMAEGILREGRADLVGMTRAQIADPDLVNKVRIGELDEIRTCVGCNSCMEVVYGLAGGIQCTMNHEAGREGESIPLTKKPKKVLIVGGGVAGLKAAQIAALRGHQVTLYEQKLALGGRVLMASMVPVKEELGGIVSYLIREVKKLDVTVLLGVRVTSELVKEHNPEVVIVATGGLPQPPEVSGYNTGKIVDVDSLFENRAEIGKRVLVVGGDLIGCEIALYLADRGKEVTVIESGEHFIPGVYAVTRFYLRTRLNMHDVEMLKPASPKKMEDDKVTILTGKKEEIIPDVDTIVFSKLIPNNDLAKAIKPLVPELYVIGDAAKPALIHAAVESALAVASKI